MTLVLLPSTESIWGNILTQWEDIACSISNPYQRWRGHHMERFLVKEVVRWKGPWSEKSEGGNFTETLWGGFQHPPKQACVSAWTFSCNGAGCSLVLGRCPAQPWQQQQASQSVLRIERVCISDTLNAGPALVFLFCLLPQLPCDRLRGEHVQTCVAHL